MTDPKIGQDGSKGGPEWVSRYLVQKLVLLTAMGLGIFLCYRLAAPFMPALAWAVALAVLFVPFHRKVESRIKKPGMAALVSVLLILIIVVGPAAFVGQRLVAQAVKGAQLIESKVKSGEWKRALKSQPRLGPLAEKLEKQMDLPGVVKTFSTHLSSGAGSLLKGSVVQVLGVCLTFYLLFFFLRDRAACLESIRALSPLSRTEMDRVFQRVGDTIYATLYGTLVVSSAQGLLGGLMFWWLGLSAPLLWGTVMALVALAPGIGAFAIWIPAAIFLAIEGSWGKAIILTLWGMFVVGTVDNLLRPYLMGNRLKLHTVLVFISILGGLALFGSAGFILGPVTLTLTMALMEIWAARTSAENPFPVEAAD